MHDNVQYLINNGWNPTSKGTEYKGCCPFPHRHAKGRDENPSFSINSNTGEFYCYSCNAGGKSLVTLVMFLINVDKEAAIKHLGYKSTGDMQTTDNNRLMAECKTLFAKAATIPAIRANMLGYFGTRQIPITEEVMQRYDIGFGYYKIHPRLKHHNQTTLEKANIFSGDVFLPESRITIPIISRGQLIGFSCRSMTSSNTRKYINCFNKELYPMHTWMAGLEQGKEIYIVEGIFDMIRMKEYGFNAAALMGTHITKERAKLLTGYDKIYICLDNDSAGVTAATRFIETRSGILDGACIKVVNLPGRKDPDECTKEEIEEAVRNSKHIFEWILSTYISLTTPEKFLIGVTLIRKMIARFSSEDERRIYHAMIDLSIEKYIDVDIKLYYGVKGDYVYKIHEAVQLDDNNNKITQQDVRRLKNA